MPDEAFQIAFEKSTGGYQRGMALNTSIGQGSGADASTNWRWLYAALVNGGRMIEPRLVERNADRRVERFALAPTRAR